MLRPKLSYSIETVYSLTGISPYTLRNWERRFGFPNPERLENGYRAYSLDEVKVLKKISTLLSQGHKVAPLMRSLRRGETLPDIQSTSLSHQLVEHLDLLYSHLLHFDTERAQNLLASINAGLLPRNSLEIVYQPLLERLGRDWLAKKISIAQEHFGSAFLRVQLNTLLSAPAFGLSSRKKVICSTVQGELHEGGLLILAIQLKLRGWNVCYFGPNLPSAELKSVTKNLKPHLICLSTVTSTSLEKELPKLKEIPALLCIGGSGVRYLQASLPKNVFTLDLSAGEGADFIDGLSTHYLDEFRGS